MKPNSNHQQVRIKIKTHVWSKIHYQLITPNIKGARKVTIWDIEKMTANLLVDVITERNVDIGGALR
jgi:hypothetical protein